MPPADLDARSFLPAGDGLASALGEPCNRCVPVAAWLAGGAGARGSCARCARVGELVEVHRHQASHAASRGGGLPRARYPASCRSGRRARGQPEDEVLALGRPLQVTCGDGLLGRVLDGLELAHRWPRR
ncbi:MAG: hypothetical protein IPN77_11390 [Sandaracinaceae bacterium]|nr:hypothetical protein [Sandaracinaceae bacterium]